MNRGDIAYMLTFAQVKQGLLTAETRLAAVREVVDSISEQFPHLKEILGRVSRLTEDAME